MKTIDITPDYEVLTEHFARLLSEHGFQKFALDPVISLIEMVRYLDRKDAQTIEGILGRLREKTAKG